MAQMTTEMDLLRLERQYWQAIKERNVDAAMELTDDPCIVAGASGVAKVDHQAFSRIMNTAKYTLNGFELNDDATVRMIGDDVAILAYKVHEDLTVEGKHVKMNAADSSVWVRRDGRWLCALHTESLLGDPYGRDRTKK